MWRRTTNYFKTKKAYVEVDGVEMKFDSKDEAEIYLCLLELYKQDLIDYPECQKPMELVPKFEKDGTKFRKMAYLTDFMFNFRDEDGAIQPVVIDVKGWRTEVYKLKRKLFEYKYPSLTIMEVEVS